MAKFTKFIRFGLTPELWGRVRAAAQQQKISVSKLVRIAVTRYLGEASEARIEAKQPETANRVSLLDTPLVIWSPEEKEVADRVIRIHFDEDR